MSYILDALRKSEKERQQGSVPTPMTVHETSAGVPKNSRHVGLLVSTIILGLAAAVVMLSLSNKPVQTVPLPTKTPVPQSQVGSSGHEPLFAVTAQKDIQNHGENRKVKSELESRKDAVKEYGSRPFSSEKRGEILREDGQIKIPVPALRETDGIAQSVRPEPSPVPAPLPVPSPETAPMAQSAPSDPERTYSLSELPSSIRENLPKISVSSLLYSHADPSASLVRINGQQFRNGQDIAPDLKILQILPNSVILSYQSYRLRISLE